MEGDANEAEKRYRSQERELYEKHRNILFDFMDHMLAVLANLGIRPENIIGAVGRLVEHYAGLLEREFNWLNADELIQDYMDHREQQRRKRN